MLKKSLVLITTFVLASTSYLAFAGDAKDKAIAQDKKALQGSWSVTKDNEKSEMIIDGTKFTLKFKGKSVNGTFTIDPTAKPKAIDMLINDGSDDDVLKYKGMTSKAIYQLDGNKLTWCANVPGKEDRPTAIPEPGSDNKAHLTFVFERAKK